VATAIASLVTSVRYHLVEPTASFWSDAELVDYMNRGAKDLWRKILGQYQEHFLTVDTTDVTLPAFTETLAGVPDDVFQVVAIEPRVVGPTSPNQGLIFKPRKYTHPDFVQARAGFPIGPQSTIIFYDVSGAGSPVGTPVIRVAPQITVAALLRFTYAPTVPLFAASGSPPTVTTNPIPGESDQALIAWTVAYARAKEMPADQRSPDPAWMAVYATEKENLIAELAPRSIQEEEVVPAMWQDMWPDWV
jgi:hypothetical protein